MEYRVYRTPTDTFYIANKPKQEDHVVDNDLTDYQRMGLQYLGVGKEADLAALKADEAKFKDGSHPAYTDEVEKEYKRNMKKDHNHMTDRPFNAMATAILKKARRIAAISLLLAGTAQAQTATSVFGEITTNSPDPGNYRISCILDPSTAGVLTWNLSAVTCGLLPVTNLPRLWSSAAWELQRSATAFGSGSTAAGVAIVTPQEGTNLTVNISSSTVVKASAGRVFRVMVNTAGSTTGTLNNVTTTGGAAAANLVFTIPNTVGIYEVNAPMTSGIVIIPGTSQVIAVVYQ